MLFSHVKIRYQVFAQKLTWYFIGVYIIKSCIKLPVCALNSLPLLMTVIIDLLCIVCMIVNSRFVGFNLDHVLAS